MKWFTHWTHPRGDPEGDIVKNMKMINGTPVNISGSAHQPAEAFNLNANASKDAEDAESTSGATATVTRPTRPRVNRMPPWKVLLHNDEKNEMGFVVETILELMNISPQIALVKMLEAHKSGVALLVTAHREYAELLQEQFTSKGLTVTIEPDR